MIYSQKMNIDQRLAYFNGKFPEHPDSWADMIRGVSDLVPLIKMQNNEQLYDFGAFLCNVFYSIERFRMAILKFGCMYQ